MWWIDVSCIFYIQILNRDQNSSKNVYNASEVVDLEPDTLSFLSSYIAIIVCLSIGYMFIYEAFKQVFFFTVLHPMHT